MSVLAAARAQAVASDCIRGRGRSRPQACSHRNCVPLHWRQRVVPQLARHAAAPVRGRSADCKLAGPLGTCAAHSASTWRARASRRTGVESIRERELSRVPKYAVLRGECLNSACAWAATGGSCDTASFAASEQLDRLPQLWRDVLRVRARAHRHPPTHHGGHRVR